MLFKHAVQLLAAADCVLASGYKEQRLDFSPEAIPDGRIGDLYRRFKPELRIQTRYCATPFAAVDAQGKTDQGAKRSNPIGKTGYSDVGQIYARGIEKNDPLNEWGMPAIMYAWYFPKIQDSFGSTRHDWQQMVIWLSVRNNGDNAQDYDISQVSYSRPDGYRKTGSPSLVPGSTTNPTALYELVRWRKNIVSMYNRGLSALPTKDNELRDGVVWEAWTPLQQMVAWEKFTPEAKKAVGDKSNFDGKLAPFSDHPGTFISHLNASFWATAQH